MEYPDRECTSHCYTGLMWASGNNTEQRKPDTSIHTMGFRLYKVYNKQRQYMRLEVRMVVTGGLTGRVTRMIQRIYGVQAMFCLIWVPLTWIY